jgi:SAM-dependent methyltransferase
MYETSKSYRLRKHRGDFDNFLCGDGIDVGCGSDPLKVELGSVQQWDLANGDAQLMPGVPDASFDFLYSSHCLEHMRDVPETLRNWTRIVKPAGFLYLVVPDYIIYEKMTWPSMFNRDHRQSFCLAITRRHVQRPNHHHVGEDMLPLMAGLGLENVRVTFEDNGYNYNAGMFDQTQRNALAQLCFVARKKSSSSAAWNGSQITMREASKPSAP